MIVDTGDNMPITLAQAQEMVGGLVSIAFLRKERDAGRLHVFRVGNRDLTTPSAVRDMVKQWQDQQNPQDSKSEKTDTSSKTAQPELPEATKSETVQNGSGRELLSARLDQLNKQTKRYGSTSKTDTNPKAQVIPISQGVGRS